MPKPTNEDIMVRLTMMDGKLDTVTALAQKTNGRVTTIENWKNALEAVEQYKKENPTATVINAKNVTVQPKWFENDKLVGGVVALLLAAAALVTFLTTGGR